MKRALVSIVSKNQMLVMLINRINKLPNENDFNTNEKNNNDKKKRKQQNYIHGLLLQIQNLLSGCYAELTSQKWIMEQLLPIWLNKIWICKKITMYNQISAIILQSYLVITYSILHRLLFFNNSMLLSYRRKIVTNHQNIICDGMINDTVAQFYMECYQICIALIAHLKPFKTKKQAKSLPTVKHI